MAASEITVKLKFSPAGRLKLRLSIVLIKLAKFFASSATRNLKVENV